MSKKHLAVTPAMRQAVPADVAIDALEVAMMGVPAQECPVTNHFAKAFADRGGVYAREIFMPAGTRLTSKIHKTQHFYVVLKGRVRVWTEGEGTVEIAAPHLGVTQPGTRRVLHILEDTVWVTFHPTELTDVGEIEREIIEPRGDHLIGMRQPEALPAKGGEPCPG